jgi:hypothetical protein
VGKIAFTFSNNNVRSVFFKPQQMENIKATGTDINIINIDIAVFVGKMLLSKNIDNVEVRATTTHGRTAVFIKSTINNSTIGRTINSLTIVAIKAIRICI